MTTLRYHASISIHPNKHGKFGIVQRLYSANNALSDSQYRLKCVFIFLYNKKKFPTIYSHLSNRGLHSKSKHQVYTYTIHVFTVIKANHFYDCWLIYVISLNQLKEIYHKYTNLLSNDGVSGCSLSDSSVLVSRTESIERYFYCENVINQGYHYTCKYALHHIHPPRRALCVVFYVESPRTTISFCMPNVFSLMELQNHWFRHDNFQVTSQLRTTLQ